jgi:midasin (ATPase involved in ribosome maturation)
MRATGRLLGPLAFLLLFPGLVLAQGIGDVAARERQRRAAASQGEKPRVLSNDDLQQNASTPAGAPGAGPESEPSPREDRDERGNGEAAAGPTPLEQAQASVDAARAAVVAAEEQVKALGDKLNPMSPSFIYGVIQTGDAVGEEMRTREELKQAEAHLVEAREALVSAGQDYEKVRTARPPDSPDTR